MTPPVPERPKLSREQRDKVLALLASVATDCEDACEHSWRKCRHCLAIEELAHQRKLVGLLVAELRATD